MAMSTGLNVNKYFVCVVIKRILVDVFNLYTGLFEMIVGVLTTCHTQYT